MAARIEIGLGGFAVLATLLAASSQAQPAQLPAASIAADPQVESLFYTQEEVDKIHAAMQTFMAHRQNPGDFNPDDYLNQITAIKENHSENRYYTYPQFFLESLVFHSDIDWAVWVNGQEITPGSRSKAGLQVMHIDKDMVMLQWQPPSMAKFAKIWEEHPNDDILVDSLSGTVTFTLRPNQTFSSYAMRVLEGKVMPVTIDNQTAEENVPELPPAAVGPAPVSVMPAVPAGIPDDSTELIGIYDAMEDKHAP